MAKKRETGEAGASTEAGKVGLERYLVDRPSNLNHYMLALLRHGYKADRHTADEWDRLVETIRNKPL